MESSARLKFIKQSMSITVAFLLVTHIQIAIFILSWIEIDYIYAVFIDYTSWTKENPVYGLILIQLVAVISLVLMIPSSLLALVIGYICGMLFGEIWGFFSGILLFFLTSSIASVLAFYIARYLFRDMLLDNIREEWVKTRAVLKALEKKGLKVVILCRLSPILPFGIVNYVVGASSIPFNHFIIGNIGILPGSVLFVYIAVTMGSVTDALNSQNDNDWTTWLVIIGGVMVLITSVYITYASKRELEKILKEEESIIQPLYEEEEYKEISLDKPDDKV